MEIHHVWMVQLCKRAKAAVRLDRDVRYDGSQHFPDCIKELGQRSNMKVATVIARSNVRHFRVLTKTRIVLEQ